MESVTQQTQDLNKVQEERPSQCLHVPQKPSRC